ncbi:uncharacterized protein [Bemisia tabaci]
MENFLLHRIILKLPQGNQLLYIHVKYGDVHLFQTKKTFSMWNLSISKLCSSVMALCNEEFLRKIEFELTYRSFFRLQKMSFYIASDLLLSIVKLFQKQTISLHVDMRGFHLNPLKRKGKSKEKPKKVKDATHTIPKEDFVINLKDYDSVINQVAATLQDSDRFHTFTEPPVTLDSSSIFQSSFDDKDLLINLISLDPVFDRLDKEFGLDDLELGEPLPSWPPPVGVQPPTPGASAMRDDTLSRQDGSLMAPRIHDVIKQKISPKEVAVEAEITPCPILSPSSMHEPPESPFVPLLESTRIHHGIHPEAAMPVRDKMPRREQSPPATGPFQFAVEAEIHFVPVSPPQDASAAAGEAPQQPSVMEGEAQSMQTEAVAPDGERIFAVPEPGIQITPESEIHAAPEAEIHLGTEQPEISTVPEPLQQLPEEDIYVFPAERQGEPVRRPTGPEIPLSSREAVAGDQEQVKKDKGRRKRFLARPQIPNRVLRKRYEELPNKPRSTPHPITVMLDFIRNEQKSTPKPNQHIGRYHFAEIRTYNVCSPDGGFDPLEDILNDSDIDYQEDVLQLSPNAPRLPRVSFEATILRFEEAENRRKSRLAGQVQPGPVVPDLDLNISPPKIPVPEEQDIPGPVVPDLDLNISPPKIPVPEEQDIPQEQEQYIPQRESPLAERPVPVYPSQAPVLQEQMEVPELDDAILIGGGAETIHPQRSSTPEKEVGSKRKASETEGTKRKRAPVDRLPERPDEVPQPDIPSDVRVYTSTKPVLNELDLSSLRLDPASPRPTKQILLDYLENLWAVTDAGIPFEAICKPAPADAPKPVNSYPKSDDVCLRSAAARTFTILMEMQRENLVHLEQSAPGKIVILSPHQS